MKAHRVAPIHIYEVLSALTDEDGNYKECYDNDYVVTSEDLTCEEIVELADIHTEGKLVLIYQARTANLILGRGLVPVDVDDVDCATGCNGSPIYEAYM